VNDEQRVEHLIDGWATVLTVVEDRYGGVYSGGQWLAFRGPQSRILDGGDLEDAHGSDPECARFFGDSWQKPADRRGHPEVAVGRTPLEALERLLTQSG
jgi:hypothetical protein